MDIWRSLKLIRSHFLVFVVCSIMAFLGILVGPSFGPKKLEYYKSVAKILITPNSEDVRVAGEKSANTTTWFTDESTLRTLLASQDLLDLVIESTGAKLTWLELRQRTQLDVLSEGGRQVSLLEISVMGSKPEEARLLTLTLSDKFIQYVQQLSTAEQDKTVAFLDRERRNAEREVARAQKRLLKIGIIPINAGRQDPLEEAWVGLQSKRSELERELALSEVEVEQLDVAAKDGIFNHQEAGVNVVEDAVSKEQLKLAELREVYTEHSPQVQAQVERVRRAESVQRDRFDLAVGSRRESAQRKRTKLAALLNETEKRLRDLETKRPSPEKHLEYATQERQLAMWQDNYLDLTRQLYRARVMQQSSRREGAFTIVEKPQPGLPAAGTQVANSPITRILMGVPMSLFCGLAIVMLIDYLTATMKMQPRIEEALGLPIIGTIPVLPTAMVSKWELMKGQVRRSKISD